MDILQELAKGNPAEYVHLTWCDERVEAIAIRSGWAQSISLAGLLKYIVEEINAKHEVEPLTPVELRVAERQLSGREIIQLGEVLSRYNAARRQARKESAPTESTTRHGRVELLWFGSQLVGIRIDPQWATEAAAQSMSDALTEACRTIQPPAAPGTAVASARAELLEFLG